MSNKKILQIKKELEIIRNENKGFISPQTVVEYAKDPKTFLHKEFVWDDSEAAEKYRIMQAGYLIRRITVTIVDEKRNNEVIKIREYVSLSNDRGSDGSYRHVAEVVNEDTLRLQYITDIQGDLSSFRKKLKTVSNVADKYAEKIYEILESEKKNIRFRKES